MRVHVHPALQPSIDIDVTDLLIAAIAHEIWARCGGNPALNWLEAELHLQAILRSRPRGAIPLIVLEARSNDARLRQRLRQAQAGRRATPARARARGPSAAHRPHAQSPRTRPTQRRSHELAHNAGSSRPGAQAPR